MSDRLTNQLDESSSSIRRLGLGLRCGGSLCGDGIGLVDYALDDSLLVGVEIRGEGFVELWLFGLEFWYLISIALNSTIKR
jgi:hypothetical protein